MKQPTIVAHRGLHDEHPENSLKAFLAAWNAGIEWCECDVRGSAEHEPFVFHDETLERMTDGLGPIVGAPSSFLQALNLRRGDGSIAPLCMPRLGTVIESMPEGAKLLIEIKPGVDAEVVRRTMKRCDPETCMVQSFDANILRHAIKLRSEVPWAFLVEDARNLENPMGRVYARQNTLTSELVLAWRVRNVTVGAWTVNTDADIRRMVDLGVDTIITDRPLRAREIL